MYPTSTQRRKHMKTEIHKATFFGKTVYKVHFETTKLLVNYAGLIGNYDTLAEAKKAAQNATI